MGQLVSLQGDPNPDIRKDSLRLVHIEDERHPTFLDNRLLEGVEMAYSFQIKILNESHPVEDGVLLGLDTGSEFDGDINSIFGPLYTTCIQSNKKRRNDFLIGLLKRALQITQLLKIKNQSSGSSPRTLGEKISPCLSKKTKVKSVTGIGNLNNNGSYKNEKKNKNLKYKNEPSNEKEKEMEREKDNKNIKNDEINVEEANHLFSLLSFILTTLSHLPFEIVDEPLQVQHCSVLSRKLLIH